MGWEAGVLLDALALGVIQGLLEWLPVSSSAATLLFATNALGMEPALAYSYSLFLHISTFLAPILVFWGYIRRKLRVLAPLITVSTLASMVTAGPLYLVLNDLLASLSAPLVNVLVGTALLATAFVLKRGGGEAGVCRSVEELGAKRFFLAGLVQGLAVVPGLSRSGVTMAALSLLGACPAESVRGSFVMSIPVTGMAGVATMIFDGALTGGVGLGGDVLTAVLGGLLAGVVSIGFMMGVAGRLGSRLYLLVLLVGLASLASGLLLAVVGS